MDPKKTVLYLDDEFINLENFQSCFEDEFNVFIANNANEARGILKKNEIKVLITDQRMPDINGLDFIVEVQKQYQYLSCIILTAYPESNLLIDALNRADIFRFIIKPWEEYDLKHAIVKASTLYDSKKERDILIEELRDAKIKAEESNRLKTAFLSNLSHEIRTPLNGIVGFANLIVKKSECVGAVEKYLTVVEESSNQLITTMDNIIAASKIDAGTERLRKTVFNLKDFISDIYKKNIAKAKSKNLNLSYITEDYCISTDKAKLNSILNSLVENAIKFTKEGYVKFGCKTNGESNTVFYVKDSGIGISEEKQKIIFDFFRQELHEENTRLYGGTGLGLSIAKKFVELMDGDLKLESSPGKGSHFYFSLPISVSKCIKKNCCSLKMQLS